MSSTSKIQLFLKKYFPTSDVRDLVHLYSLSLKARSREGGPAFDERATLEDLLQRLGLNSGFVVDVAASDGYSQSCTLGLFSSKDWLGLAIEMDPYKFSKLAYIYSRFPNARLARKKVTPNNIVDLLKAFEVPRDFDVLNLDIDSYDLYVVRSMLLGGFKPMVITMEINEKIPSGVFFTVDFDENHCWQGDHFFGCSIDAATEIVKEFGYILWKLDYNNAFFVRGEAGFFDFNDLSSEQAYIDGYKSQTDRKAKFPCNADVDYWLNLSSAEAVSEIADYFSKYKGKFTLRQSSANSKPLPPRP